MSDPVTQMLINYLYGTYTKCGPEHKYQSRHRDIRLDYSNVIKDVPYILPDNCYHPEAYICLDFSYQFVRNEPTKEIEGRRLISEKRLENITKEIMDYYYYYYEYVCTYGKKQGSTDLYEFLQDLQWDSEDEKNIFLNTFVNFYLTQINVERSRTGIGSATVVLRDNPNYKDNKKMGLFLDKGMDILNQLFVPMLPIMIWARGRLYKDWYFPLFDGYIISPTSGNTQGFTTITLMCKDILELARVSQQMINPAILQVDEFEKQNYVNIYQKPLYGLDHFVIFNLMIHGNKNTTYVPVQTDENGNKVPGTGRLLGDSTEDKKLLEKYKSTKQTNDNWYSFSALANLDAASMDINSDKVKNLLDYQAINKKEWSFDAMYTKTSHKMRRRATINWGNNFTPYRIFGTQAPDTFTSEFATRLDTLREVSETVYYDLYVDAYGNIQYHPMRIANDFLKYDIYEKNDPNKVHEYPFPGSNVIGIEEVINMNSNLNIEELCTFIRLKGTWPYTNPPPPELLKYTGSYTDMKYFSRYGFRRKEISNSLFNENALLTGVKRTNSSSGKMYFLDLAASSFLTYANAELYTRTASIVFRPELELAAPIVFPDDNSVFYLQSLSHSITIGGDATTTINANMGRLDKEDPPDLFSFLQMGQILYDNGGNWTDIFYQLIEQGQADISILEDNESASTYQQVLANLEWTEMWGEEREKNREELDALADQPPENTQDKKEENSRRQDNADSELERTQSTRRNAGAKKAVAEARKRFGF